MTETTARELAAVISGQPVSPMPSSRTWGVVVDRPVGGVAAIEDTAGRTFRDREAFDAYQREGDEEGILAAQEWGEWDGSESWALGLSRVLGSEEYWHSGGGIWLVFYRRPDGRFAVIGSESGGIYANHEEFDTDLYGGKAENHVFV